MTTNIQMNRRTSASGYQDIYPTSDAAQIQRRQKIISYLDGDTLEAIIQDTANQYIDPLGSRWIGVDVFNETNTYLCGVDNFTCFLLVDNGELYSSYSADNGLTWLTYGWSLSGISLNSFIGGVAVRGKDKNTFNICVANATSTSYYLTIDTNDSLNNSIESFSAFTGTVTGIAKTKDSFMMYGNSGYIYLNPFSDTSTTRAWTRTNVSLPTNISKIIYSDKYCKPIGIMGLNQAYPTWLNNTSLWTTSTVTPTGTTIIDVDDTGDIFLGSNGIVYDTARNKTYNMPSLNNDPWKYILTTTDGEDIFVLSTQGKLARKIAIDGDIELVDSVDLGDSTNGQFLILNNQIFGSVRADGDQQTTLFRAPLYSYK